MTSKDRPKGRRDLAREALRRATARPEPEMSRLLEAVPEMVAEARRRRRLQERLDPVAAVVPLAWKAIPRLAVAALLFAAVSAALFFTDTGSARDGSQGFEALFLDDASSGAADDPLFEALIDPLVEVEQENGNG
jgi:hypothetical protein